MTQRVRTETYGRRSWSPAQILSGILGLVFLVMGGVTIARTGFSDLTATADIVYTHSTLLGLIEVFLGLIFLSGASRPAGSSRTLIGTGAVMLAFGLIVAIEPDPFQTWLGGGQSMGIAYAVVGAIAVAVGWSSLTTVTEVAATNDVVRRDDPVLRDDVALREDVARRDDVVRRDEIV